MTKTGVENLNTWKNTQIFDVMDVTTGSRWVQKRLKRTKRVQEGKVGKRGASSKFFERSDNFWGSFRPPKGRVWGQKPKN